MNNWGTHREIEKLKKPTQLERHQTLRTEVNELQALIKRRDAAIIETFGRENPIRRDFAKCSDLLDRLVAELRGAS